MAEIIYETIKDVDGVECYIKRGEVVRCKDCRFYDPQKERCDHPNLDFYVECYDHWLNMKPDDFCSCGERRT